MFAMIGLLFLAVGVGVTVSSKLVFDKYKHLKFWSKVHHSKMYYCIFYYINPLSGNALHFFILLCLTPDDFTRQGESAATQWVNIFFVLSRLRPWQWLRKMEVG